MKWSFVLTLNRASALTGKGRGQNILLPYKSRFNIKKDRFRVKSKTSQLWQEKVGDYISCYSVNLVSIYERIGLESKRKENACFWLSILPLPAQLPVSSHFFSCIRIVSISPTSKLRVKTRTMHTATRTTTSSRTAHYRMNSSFVR